MKLQVRWTAAFALSALLLAAAKGASAENNIVRTAAGLVSGVAASQGKVAVFEGIPYAAPPVGKLRWRPPQPVSSWKGVRKADAFSASCMQETPEEFLPWTPEFMTHGAVSEDCLYLNVWTPRASASAGLPVIVFIHGGAFTSGSGKVAVYDGTNLAATGVVVVTINYRLGVFGFFAYPGLTAESPHHSSGNYGLMDQMAALRWVKDNIRGFGGDPSRVTIWGQSAGAFSVNALVVSPLGVGLFERAQADSGIGISGFPLPDLSRAEAAGVKFAETHPADSLSALRAVPAAELLDAAVHAGNRFGPDIDGWVLPDSMMGLQDRGEGSDVPITTGYQANDWMLGSPHVQTVAAYNALASRLYGEMAQDFLRLYPAANAEEAAAMEKLSSEDRDRVSMLLWAADRAEHFRTAIYTYYFDRAIPWPQHPEYGAFHTGEIPYFFRNLNLLDRPWTPVDFTLSAQISSYLKNFAAKGDPNGDDLPEWPRHEGGSATTMELGEHMGPVPVADPARLAFWKKYFASAEGQHAPIF